MGQWNYKNYVLELNFYDNPTDPRIVEFMKGLDFTTMEWDEFIKGKLPLQSKRSQEMISFVVSYHDGELCPDKWNSYEPVKRDFNKDDLSGPIGTLSFPGGWVFLKKKRKLDITIKNMWYGLTFIDDKVVSPQVLGEYIMNMTILIAKEKKPDLQYMKSLLEDVYFGLRADSGQIIDQETHEVLYDIKEKNVQEF